MNERKPSPVHRSVQTASGLISYTEQGTGPVALLVHGVLLNSYLWRHQLAERWVESCRRDLLDHIITLNERHLKRLLYQYVRYHHQDRTHLGLAKQTPAARTACTPPGRIVSRPRLGGLHHRYDRAA